MLIETSYCAPLPHYRLMLLGAGRGMEESHCVDNLLLVFLTLPVQPHILKLALNLAIMTWNT